MRFLPLIIVAQILVVFEILRFIGFSQNFSENVDIKNFTKLYHLCSERYTLSRYTQKVRFSPPNMTAQILLDYEINNFRDFSKIS